MLRDIGHLNPEHGFLRHFFAVEFRFSQVQSGNTPPTGFGQADGKFAPIVGPNADGLEGRVGRFDPGLARKGVFLRIGGEVQVFNLQFR